MFHNNHVMTLVDSQFLVWVASPMAPVITTAVTTETWPVQVQLPMLHRPLPLTLWAGHHYSPHFTNEEAETQIKELVLGTVIYKMAGWSLKVWQQGSRDHVPMRISRGFQNCSLNVKTWFWPRRSRTALLGLWDTAFYLYRLRKPSTTAHQK